MRVVVVGSSNTDLVIQAPRLPSPGETILGGEFRQFPGGKGANQAVAAARAGAEVTFVGLHGDDAYGAQAKTGLNAEGIDTRWFRERRGVQSGIALILIGGRKRENMIAVARSANDLLGAEDVRKAESAIRKADAVVAQLEVPLEAVMEAALLADKHGVPFILNPAPARHLPTELLQKVHTLVPNQTEAVQLTRGEFDGGAWLKNIHAGDGMQCVSTLRRMGCRQSVITLGAKGAFVAPENDPSWIKAPRAKVVDTVGAGDCFTAWLTVGIASGMNLYDAAKAAVKAASIAVTRPGAQSGMPFAAEVKSPGRGGSAAHARGA